MNLTRIYGNAKSVINNLGNNLASLFLGLPHQPQLAYLPVFEVCRNLPEPNGNSSFIDSLKDAFLYAVPKSRRTIEKRRSRRFGCPEYNWKMLVPKTNIIVCNTCGGYHEAGVLCGTCYKRIREETEAIQKAIEAEYKLEPVDKEVVVLYNKELEAKGSEFWKGKRIVEMKKERPSWFSQNLLQKTTDKDIEETPTKPVKPSDLA